MSALQAYIEADVEFSHAIVSTKPLAPVYDLAWIDVRLHDEPVRDPAKVSHVRRFAHIGASIAWARRQLFHGKVFGDSIELRVIHRSEYRGAIREREDEVQEITLMGFRRWRMNDDMRHLSGSLLEPVRKCRVARDV